MDEITYNIDTEKNIIFTRIKGEINLINLLIHMTNVEHNNIVDNFGIYDKTNTT